MFGFGKSKKDYKKICQDPAAVAKLLYTDRSKTAEILGDSDFIGAWLDSENQREITMIIRKQAIAGDVPSLKQMVWLLGNMHQEISQAEIPKEKKLEALIGLLSERINYCDKLISKGVPQHYYAMISLHHLYRALHELSKPGTLEKTRDTLNEMVKHAHAVVEMGKDHPTFDGDSGFIEDAKNILREGDDFRKLLNAMGDDISKLDGQR
ncbi:hypothetical protein [Tropicimonas isoalkanivorans]|uniref:Uncharacterized protein n=1 Tax=Tropicimonas isoalkanivorans TaxID=441112 RepID=A0A1I1QFP3_9RHOB|nr:hypothetical protein [Tropicimonas isoalkanivorans]SFD20822.1 hypothetical protein SAMN04488094_12046 [Tropicimonas isoalkanivorans]